MKEVEGETCSITYLVTNSSRKAKIREVQGEIPIIIFIIFWDFFYVLPNFPFTSSDYYL